MSETIDSKTKVLEISREITLSSGQFIAVDTSTLRQQEDGSYLAKGAIKIEGLFWRPKIADVSVVYDSKGIYKHYQLNPDC